MKKVSKFLKNYGFYLATGVICIGALTAIFLMPGRPESRTEYTDPYARNETAQGTDLQHANNEGATIIDEDDLDTTDGENLENDEAVAGRTEEEQVSPSTETEQALPEQETESAGVDEAAQDTAEVTPETFDSTTASVSQEPFFAEGDTLAWPVEGDVVVPYTDDDTSYWYSETLNQTMRTFGVCISGEEGTEVKADAKGTVTEIIEDSSEYLEKGMPFVGKLMIIDHGNGYISIYGFQGGTVNEELVGQVVNAGDVLGTMGSPKGAFISEGDNIYLQVKHNDKVINPLNLLETADDVAKDEGVDVGFAE